MNINENITSNIITMIKSNTPDINKSFKLLNIYYDVKIPTDILNNDYKNLIVTDYKIKDPYIVDLNFDEKFDFIIFGEVIEKLVNYNVFLNNLKKHLENEGKVICSIQNIMNRDVLKGLLSGKFTYSEEGILNKSSLRFFTLEEIRGLFNKEMYDLDHIVAIIQNPTKEEVVFINELCSITDEKLKLNFNASSYILTTSKKINRTLFDYVLNP